MAVDTFETAPSPASGLIAASTAVRPPLPPTAPSSKQIRYLLPSASGRGAGSLAKSGGVRYLTGFAPVPPSVTSAALRAEGYGRAVASAHGDRASALEEGDAYDAAMDFFDTTSGSGLDPLSPSVDTSSWMFGLLDAGSPALPSPPIRFDAGTVLPAEDDTLLVMRTCGCAQPDCAACNNIAGGSGSGEAMPGRRETSGAHSDSPGAHDLPPAFRSSAAPAAASSPSPCDAALPPLPHAIASAGHSDAPPIASTLAPPHSPLPAPASEAAADHRSPHPPLQTIATAAPSAVAVPRPAAVPLPAPISTASGQIVGTPVASSCKRVVGFHVAHSVTPTQCPSANNRPRHSSTCY
eukprot:TRINITY_DN79974_c0_g1_i1.p1 TRINITY_DN79974_c0_g1~~TRINITY_DN79974_c0_g1_i1.p1  ORF type:complete len:352 (-),score=-35.19 TRINITY_DN79974_c0_g1_i1:411-1466(-)